MAGDRLGKIEAKSTDLKSLSDGRALRVIEVCGLKPLA
jgi:hypothetical protein